MKKASIIIVVLLLTVVTFLLGFNTSNGKEPQTYYQVYLDDQILGVINSEEELNNYIDKEGDAYKEQYGVENVYAPTRLKIKKMSTYHDQVDDVEDVYKKISETSPFTIKGYQLSIKSEDETIKIYVTDEQIFQDAVIETIKTFIGTEEYTMYMDGTQPVIETTGTNIENIYVEEEMTIKEMNIPVTETIYTNVQDLAKYLLFGTLEPQRTYIVQVGDTIERVALNNQISVEEFLISNPQFKSESNLLFPGQEVTIGMTDPKISVVKEEHVIEDVASQYRTEEIHDETLVIGDEVVTQEGVDGIIRVNQMVKSINGTIVYVDPISTEEIKPAVNRIVRIGTKYVSGVGSTTNWVWPTNSGWTISSSYGYRIDPFDGTRSFHGALDIAGTGYNSPIYAATNGVVMRASYSSTNGYYVIINHNNGYYTQYAHMIRMPSVSEGQIVERGQVIGYVGSTGAATGPHVHFEVWVGRPYNGGYRINPYTMY